MYIISARGRYPTLKHKITIYKNNKSSVELAKKISSFEKLEN